MSWQKNNPIPPLPEGRGIQGFDWRTMDEQSKLLGSSSWCIVRDEFYFKSYIGDGNKQYFIYD